MKDNENLYDKIKELIGSNPENVSIMEEIIDVELQVEYFEYSKRISVEFEPGWALNQKEHLKDKFYPLYIKKQILSRLASLEDVAAYRAIESYAGNPDKELKDWSVLALQESRMHMEGHLLEKDQIFISTGLGGKANKLRYYVVLIARNREHFTDFQKKIIQDEFTFVVERYEGEVEGFESSGYLAAFSLLLPIQYAVNEVFSEGINECNQYGDFLRENCIVTNVKKLTFDEVREFIEQKKKC